MNFFERFKKNTEIIKADEFISENFKIGSTVKFDELEFSNTGLNSKFIFEEYDNEVESIGIYKLDDIKHVNIYLKTKNDEKSYLTFIYDTENKSIKNCRFFRPYDEIYPKTEEEWLYWIGNETIEGIMNDETFTIEDEPIEKIGELLFKLTKRFYPTFKSFNKSKFNDQDSCITTDLFYNISSELNLNYNEVKEKFEEELSKSDWMVEILKNEEDEKMIEIYFVLSEGDLDIEYSNYYNINSRAKYKEKIYKDHNLSKYIDLEIKSNTIFYRKIEDEFFDEEYISITLNEGKFESYITIDLGIPLLFGKIREIKK